MGTFCVGSSVMSHRAMLQCLILQFCCRRKLCFVVTFVAEIQEAFEVFVWVYDDAQYITVFRAYWFATHVATASVASLGFANVALFVGHDPYFRNWFCPKGFIAKSFKIVSVLVANVYDQGDEFCQSFYRQILFSDWVSETRSIQFDTS